MRIRNRIARFLASDEFEALEKRKEDLTFEVNQRVADVLVKMDPIELLLKKYHIVFSKEYERPEDSLDSPSQIRLFMWAYSLQDDPSFKYLMDWIRNTQGNATVRKAKNDYEWFFGRAAISIVTLLVEEVSRLASHYKDILASKDKPYDEKLTIE